MRISDWSADVCSSDLLLVLVATGAYIVYMHGAVPAGVIAGFFALALVYGVMMTMPIGGADMPVVISLYNAFTGLAVGFEGYVLNNPALMIAGMVVGSAGTLLTLLMAKAMNRSVAKRSEERRAGTDGVRKCRSRRAPEN